MIADIKISGVNLLEWSYMEDWAESGTSAAPTGHTLSGAGASVSRETTIIKHGLYSAGVVRGGADASLYHDLSSYQDYQGRTVKLGFWVYATVASRGRIGVSDGVGSTNSSYHTGGSGWEFLEVEHEVDASATRLRCECHVNTGDTTVYFDGGILCDGDTTFTTLTDSADVQRWDVRRTLSSQRFTPARTDGQIIKNQHIKSLTVRARLAVYGSTVALGQSQSDTVLKAVNTNRVQPNGEDEKKDLFIKNDRYLRVFASGTESTKYETALRFIPIDLTFTAPEPFHNYINKSRGKTTLSSSPTTATVTNVGNAQAYPQIKVTAGGADITALTVENLCTGQSFSYSGTISSGNEFILDSANLTAENNGSSDFANFSGDSRTRLVSGDNRIKVTFTGGSTDSVLRVDWRDRWY